MKTLKLTSEELSTLRESLLHYMEHCKGRRQSTEKELHLLDIQSLRTKLFEAKLTKDCI